MYTSNYLMNSQNLLSQERSLETQKLYSVILTYDCIRNHPLPDGITLIKIFSI